MSDTLGAKLRKILERQLALGRHPAAAASLPRPVDQSQALLRGWLFYRRGEQIPVELLGISQNHCRGWWCTPDEIDTHVSPVCAILPRLSWLAPARLNDEAVRERAALKSVLANRFLQDPTPVMVASLSAVDGAWLETDRGFVVPDDWQDRADRRWRGLVAPAN